MKERAVGLLGGTFNPIHYGHLQLAEMAMAECRLDEVIFVPSALPPHKNVVPLASFADRLAMVQLAIAGKPGFSCSAIERNLPAPSYTIETLKAIDKQINGEILYFLIGSDALMDLLSWREYGEILRRVSLLVARRQDASGAEVESFLARLGYRQVERAWHRLGNFRPIVVLQQIPKKYSSTAIRRRIAGGSEPSGETPEAVLSYIKEHGLYRAE